VKKHGEKTQVYLLVIVFFLVLLPAIAISDVEPSVAVIKYDLNGQQLWKLEIPGAQDDSYYLTPDHDGNFFVWGSIVANFLSRIDPAGNVLWKVEEQLDELLVDSENDVIYIDTEVYNPNRLAKKNADGDLLWENVLDGIDPYNFAIDGGDNIYLTEWDDTNEMSFIVKYSPDGEEIWRIAGQEQNQSNNLGFWNIYCSNEGVIYVDGWIKYDEGDNRFVAQYQADGTRNWLVITTGVWENYFLTGVDGGVYSVTQLYESQPLLGYAVTRWDDAGNVLWTYAGTWDERIHVSDYVIDFQVDDEGSAIVLGSVDCIESSGYCQRLALAKIDPDGNLLWRARWDEMNSYVSSMAIDNQHNIIVAGDECLSTEPSGCTQSIWMVAKIDADGNSIWTTEYNVPADSFESASGVAVDADDNVYVAGAYLVEFPDDDTSSDDDGSSDDDSSSACGC
jgi:hypothetical protein